VGIGKGKIISDELARSSFRLSVTIWTCPKLEQTLAEDIADAVEGGKPDAAMFAPTLTGDLPSEHRVGSARQ